MPAPRKKTESNAQPATGRSERLDCATLDILPPNLVNLIAGIEARGLVERRPHPSDGRAVGLHLTAEGEALVRDAEQAATQLETDASAKLSGRERDQLIKLLQKIYRP